MKKMTNKVTKSKKNKLPWTEKAWKIFDSVISIEYHIEETQRELRKIKRALKKIDKKEYEINWDDLIDVSMIHLDYNVSCVALAIEGLRLKVGEIPYIAKELEKDDKIEYKIFQIGRSKYLVEMFNGKVKHIDRLARPNDGAMESIRHEENLNDGGIAHTKDEIEKVRDMLLKE